MHVLTKYQAASGSWRLLVNGNVHPLLVGFNTPEEAVAKGAILFPKGILVETPKTFLNWTLPGEEIKTPFDLPPIVQESISLDYLIGLLKNRFNIGYMPLATGKVSYNRKPEYVTENELQNLSCGSGTYMLKVEALKTFSFEPNLFLIEPYAIYAGIDISPGVEILVNLNNPYTCTYVRMDSKETNKNAWINWTHELLNIDKHKLKDIVEESF